MRTCGRSNLLHRLAKGSGIDTEECLQIPPFFATRFDYANYTSACTEFNGDNVLISIILDHVLGEAVIRSTKVYVSNTEQYIWKGKLKKVAKNGGI